MAMGCGGGRRPGPKRGRPWRGKGRPGAGLGLAGLAVLLALALTSWLVDVKLRPALDAWARQQVVTLATQAINGAVRDHIGQGMSRQLVSLQADPSQRVVALVYDFPAIHTLEATLAQAIEANLQALSRHLLRVPLGQITGIDLLAALGPLVPVRIVAAYGLKTDTRFDFRSAGFNQVLHNIYLDVEVTMRVVAPLMREEVPVRQRIVLSSVWLSGEVPQFLLNWSGDAAQLEQWLPRWSGDPALSQVPGGQAPQ